MYAPRPMIDHPRPQCAGNLALLVLVDSRGSYTDTSVVDETVLVALHHLGLPFRLHDLAAGPLTAGQLASCSAVIIAQARLGRALSPADSALLAVAVEEQGLGLVNFDGALHLYDPSLLSLFGLEVDPIPIASDLLRIGDHDHFITETQQQGSQVRLHRPITFAQIRRMGKDVVELVQATLGKDQLIFARHHVPGTAYEPGHHPALLAVSPGQGRAVQFTCSPRLWHHDFLGHGMGLDGLFWRSIVWAARKPFVAQMMPPFVTLRVDDASGRHDLRYADVMVRHGHCPLISCFLDRIPDHVLPLMKSTSDAGTVDWDAHAFDYYELIPYRFGIGEYTDGELEIIFGRLERWYGERGLRQPGIAYFHWGEVGVRALPYLKASGRKFLYSTYDLGQLKWERFFPKWWPYGLNSLFYDYFPEDPEIYNVGAGLPRHLIAPDVLTGCTTWANENTINDMEKAAGRSAHAVRMALDSGFFAEMGTHEQKFAVLTLEEIDRWLGLLGQKIEGLGAKLVGHELAASYTRARDEAWLADAAVGIGGQITLSLEGTSDLVQELAVFENEGASVVRRWEPVPAFTQDQQVEF